MSNIKDIVDLIAIRNYVSNSVNNFSLKREVSNELNSMTILLDKMIIDQLMGKEFKELINFGQASEAVKEVVKTTNLKSSMNPSNKFVTIEEGKPEVK